MAAKILAKFIFTTGSILVRSVAMAYKQAVTQADAGMGAAAAGANMGLRSKMTPIEAKKILGLDNQEIVTKDDIEARHKELIELNDPKDGGSEFLQIKISGAKYCLTEAINSGKKI